MGFMPELRVPRTFKSLVVNDTGMESAWANEDILPVSPENQTYTWKAYCGYWCAVGCNVTVWSIGSSHLANGLDAGAAIGGVFLGAMCCVLVAVLCGEPGIKYHLGFPMMSRATFGMYGSFFVIMVKVFVNFIFFGIQSYWGGLAFNVILRAIFPSFQYMQNTLPASAGITTQQLIGFVVYIIVFTSMMFIHPTKLQRTVWMTQAMALITFLGLFIWAVSTNKGASFLPPGKEISGSERSFRILNAMSSVAGSWTGAAIRQSDWTRFTKSRPAVWWHQIVTAPIVCTIFATMGIAATSAVANMYGSPIWNPISLLEFLLRSDYSATTRAGCFFAGVGFFCSQVVINLVQNSVSCGMDLAALYPKYIDVTRGSLIMCLVGYLIQPWRFVNQAGIFISVLSSFGMFVAPLAGINAVDFWYVRQRRWKIPDLYVGNKSSIYWFTYGWSWRAMLAWCLVVWASFPGMISAMNPAIKVDLAWTRCFNVTWIIGFLGGGLVYGIICTITPPPGKPFVEELLDSHHLDGRSGSSQADGSETDPAQADSVSGFEKGGATKERVVKEV